MFFPLSFRSPAPKRSRLSEEENVWLHKTNNSFSMATGAAAEKNSKTSSSSIMAPVLKKTDQSFWLAKTNKMTTEEEEEPLRAPVYERGN